MDPKVTINYPCSKCEAPIQLDAGFSHMSEHTKAELALPVFRGGEFVVPACGEEALTAASIDKFILPSTFSTLASTTAGLPSGGGSCASFGYTVLGCPANPDKAPALRVSGALLDLASAHSAVDHPLCEECTDALILQVEAQLHFTASKARSYAALLEELHRLPLPDTTQLQRELAQLTAEEEALAAEVAEVVAEQKEAERLLEDRQQQAVALGDEEERYWVEYCRQKSLLVNADEERVSVHNQLVQCQQQLERLKRTNIFSIAFHIWKTDHISTINNFRLGKLPTQPVLWPEINAALGQAALLLVSLARKFHLDFSKYNLVPYGNHSYLEVKGAENKILPLYTHGGIKYIFDHSFDLAMVAFLECFGEFVRFLERCTNTAIGLPYPINKHCLEDSSGGRYSVKIQFNPEEQWTKALKYLLTNLKWCLTWVSAPALSQDPATAAAGGGGASDSLMRSTAGAASAALTASAASAASAGGYRKLCELWEMSFPRVYSTLIPRQFDMKIRPPSTVIKVRESCVLV